MTIAEFAAKWRDVTVRERAGAQEHFIDLCRVLGEKTPAEADPGGHAYAFEKRVTKLGGGEGYADVWRRDRFAWEYKGKRKDLRDAYVQLNGYREALGNPPLLVVCDLDRFEVHTNFTGTDKVLYAFTLADLAANVPTATCPMEPLEVLRAVFENPGRLRPDALRQAQVTEAAAREFATLARSLQARGHEPHAVARFLIRVLFCLFAEDIGLLKEGLFTETIASYQGDPAMFSESVGSLFRAMARGGPFGAARVRRFNGDLFTDDTALDLTAADMRTLHLVARMDWRNIEPSIFGTLFERSLDPGKRSQLGAHYTSRADIEEIVGPVVLVPLRRRWEQVQGQASAVLGRRRSVTVQIQPGVPVTPAQRRQLTETETELRRLLQDFADELKAVRVLDPACGSGNFLYVALKHLLDLEREVIAFAAAECGLTGFFPGVGPEQMRGVEVNAYAHELAPVTIWIGYIQWLYQNGYGRMEEPILRRMDMIVQQDALLSTDPASGAVTEATWPEADFIVGNPPFLGGKMLRSELGDEYVGRLFGVYDGAVPREADLVTYWFEKARALVAAGQVQRAGLLATNSIRGGANRRVLERIKSTGDIFMAWSDRPWVLNGAAVRVSMVGFDAGAETERTLDGVPAAQINPDLTGALDLTRAARLAENLGLAFMGDTKGGPFDIPGEVAAQMLSAPLNPNGRPNRDVVRPWVNGLDVTRRPRGMYIIDFGADMSEDDAALYEKPYEYAQQYVKPVRAASRSTRKEWWIHERPRPDMNAALGRLARFIATPTVAKYRLFVWLSPETVADHQLIAIAREDDYFFGVLQSRVHELWALRMGTSLEDRPRYTPSTTFETFPFPYPPGHEPTADPEPQAIADAARELVRLRDHWLNPPDVDPAELKKRTLTNLYNARPAWLDRAHARLDAAVFAAYGWPESSSPADLPDDAILERLLALNRGRAG